MSDYLGKYPTYGLNIKEYFAWFRKNIIFNLLKNPGTFDHAYTG